MQLLCSLNYDGFSSLFGRAGLFDNSLETRLKSVETFIDFLRKDKSNELNQESLELLSRMLTLEKNRYSAYQLYLHPVVEKWLKSNGEWFASDFLIL